MSKLTRFFRIPNRRKFLLAEAAILSGYYRFRITRRPMQELAAGFGTFQYETPEEEITDPILRDISWAVSAEAYHVAWNSLCMDRALAAKNMLNRRGYPCTLYLGLKQNEDGELAAHAWLRCGTRWVSGGNGKNYAVTGIYGDQWEHTQ